MPPCAFSTPVTISGPLRRPVQLLGEQEYGGHGSIHDSSIADSLGFASGAIEGPVHFSQFAPLLVTLWGTDWISSGCLSVHYSSPCIAGEEVRAYAEVPAHGATAAKVWMAKADGTLVLSGTASLKESQEPTEAQTRLAGARSPDGLQIIDQLRVGLEVPMTRVRIDPNTLLGPLYPFTLSQKLDAITEMLSYYSLDPADSSVWKAAVLPIEMVSVLFQYTDNGLPVRQPSVGLFLDQEIQMENGPVFAGTDYDLKRSVVALSESRRTESYWLKSTLRDPNNGSVIATGLLHIGMFKDSYPGFRPKGAP